MDSDIEIVEDDDLERYHPRGMLNDFSQVKIQVHGADVAERILEDLEDETEDLMEVQHSTEYLELDVVQIQASPEDPGNYLDIADPLAVNLEELSQDYSERDACNYIEEEPEQEEGHATEEPILENHLDVVTAGQLKDNSYEDVIIKEEIDLFDGTDYTDLDEGPVETYYADLPPENICHFSNKIILGSKPCHYKEVSSQLRYEDDLQKEYLTAEVVLEDWGERLEENPCFCKKCGILFATQNVLDSHNMTTHSFLVAVGKNKAIKSTAKPHARAFARKSTGAVAMNNNIAKKSTARSSILVSKFCNHCNKLFPNHTDLIKHLYELLPFNKQFTCSVCKASFNTQKELMNHNTVHIKKEKPHLKKEKIHKDGPDFKKKLVFEEDVKKKRRVSSKNEAVFIPLSALFQCLRCNTHFLSIFAGLQHMKTCNLKTVCNKGVTCKICKRRLREVDALVHKKQHEVSNKFKVYKITQNLYARTLCKCPKCGVHYNDYTINRHLETCGKIPTSRCQKCDILIPNSKLAEHERFHEKENLKPNDFIKVQYFIVQNNTNKRKPTPIVSSANKTELGNSKIIKKEPIANMKVSKVMASKIKKQVFNNSTTVAVKKEKSMTGIKMVNRLKKKHKLKMYFCNLCERCYVKETRRSIHLNKTCKASCLKDRGVCVECGLYVSRKGATAHMKQHRKIHFTINDIAFYNIRTLRRTVPSIPTYPQCKNCKIIFINKKVRQEHICGENYKTCKTCGDKFDISTYDIHIAFHKLVKAEPEDKTEVKIMPNLVKKYESLNVMWNILYSCIKCEIVTDSYDKAVEHSQTHLTNTATCKNIKCYICNLKFDESCWSKHSDLHSRMNINSKDFKMLKYNPKVLKSEEWFELFDTLSQEQIRQITDKSLYGYERSVTMKLLKDGRPEFTLYCCSNCKICFQHYEIAKHMSSACKNSANHCKTCNIPFNDVNALRLHEILHVKGIKKEEFRIVSFLKNKVGAKKSTGTFVINKCRKCNICVRYKHNLNRHVCRPRSQSSICSICQLIFNKRNMPKHMREHKLKPSLKPKNIQIDLFDPCNIADNLHNDEDAGFNLKPVKRKYQTDHTKKSKPAKVPKTDTRKSTKSDTSKASINDTPIMVKVFKCECGLHYISLKSIEKHSETCSSDSDISKENCSKCGLLFPTDVLVNHLCKHHSKNTKIVIETYKKAVKPESFESVESTSESPTSKMANSIKKSPISTKEMAKSQSQNNQVKLFKCSDCNVYYLSQSTCYKHIYKDHKRLDPRLYVECKHCGLQFTIRSLFIHISNHHQNEFNLDNVLVEEYHPRYGKQSAKIDIYIASEKLQSLQVTSSIDETNISDS